MRLTPPRRASLRMSGLVTPLMLSLKIFLLKVSIHHSWFGLPENATHLWRFAPPTLPRARPFPATPRPPIPPIEVFPLVVFAPAERPGAMAFAFCGLYVLVLICFDVLVVEGVGWRETRPKAR